MTSRQCRLTLYLLAILYASSWATTGFVGLPQIDRKFDEDLSIGSIGYPHYQIKTVKRIPFFDAADPLQIPAVLYENPWRCRSRGFSIAPFIVIDEVAWQTDALSGFAGTRIVFWFFGRIHWVPLRKHWVS